MNKENITNQSNKENIYTFFSTQQEVRGGGVVREEVHMSETMMRF